MKVVVVPDGSPLPEEDIAAFADMAVPPYMRPRYIELADALPRTLGTAKIQRFRLRENWRTPRTWDVESHRHISTQHYSSPREEELST
jgi:crotonobetaine/carnitine-CoA ligase